MSQHNFPRQFLIQGEMISVYPVEMGHIHDSFISTWETDRGPVRYLHQRLNQHVFPDVAALMGNIRLVTDHLRAHPGGAEKTLRLVPSTTGQDAWIDSDSACWRTFGYIENTEVFDVCPNPDYAFEAGRIFGSFLVRLADLDPNRLSTTIPHFFDTPVRVSQLKAAVEKDRSGRLDQVVPEVEFVLQREAFCSIITDPLREKRLPQRVIHYDPKINNVLFDRDSGKGVCVVDLDTCMPGSLLYDFGDLVRTAGVDTAEDEPDISRIGLSLTLYQALLEGYLECLGPHLTGLEIRLLSRAPRLATLTIGMRFLADFISGDLYFKVAHPEQNLHRARAQFALVQSMEELEPEMEQIVSQLTAERLQKAL